MATATDDFNRADASSLGANWTDLSGNFQIVSNEARSKNNGVFDSVLWNANSFGADQYSQVKDTTVTNYFGPCCRHDGTAVGSGDTHYFIYTGGAQLLKRVAGAQTQIASFSAPSANTTVKVEANGTTIAAYYGGVSQASVTDGSIASGSVGLWGCNAGAGGDDWEGGDIGGGGGGARPSGLMLLGVR